MWSNRDRTIMKYTSLAGESESTFLVCVQISTLPFGPSKDNHMYQLSYNAGPDAEGGGGQGGHCHPHPIFSKPKMYPFSPKKLPYRSERLRELSPKIFPIFISFFSTSLYSDSMPMFSIFFPLAFKILLHIIILSTFAILFAFKKVSFVGFLSLLIKLYSKSMFQIILKLTPIIDYIAPDMPDLSIPIQFIVFEIT